MQKRSYRRLRAEDREIIYRMSKAGKTQHDISLALGVTQSTVSKELARNRGLKGYRYKQADAKANERQAAKKKRNRVIVDTVEEQVRKRLELKHSPEQISLRLKSEGVQVSHESIYRYVIEEKHQGGARSTDTFALTGSVAIDGARKQLVRRYPSAQGSKSAPKQLNNVLGMGTGKPI